MKSEKKKEIENIKKNLNSSSDNEVIEGILKMRASGNSETLDELFYLLDQNPSQMVREKIFDLLNDLKMQSSAETLINYISSHKKSPFLKDLIAACWQNGLDYSQQIELFTELALENDYLVGIEVFSVIQENIDLVSDAKRYEIAAKFEKRNKSLKKQEKKKLIHEIISLIIPASGPFLMNKET